MSNTQDVFRSFWYGDRLPRHAQLCLASFVDRGSPVALYAFRKLDAPFGVELRDAAEVLPESQVFYYKTRDGSRGTVSGFANWFRYVLLAREGGWWIDADVLRLEGPLPQTPLYFGWESDVRIGNAVMKAPLATPFLRAAERETAALGANAYHGQTGPGLITRLVHEHGVVGEARPAEEVYPIPHEDYAAVTRAAETTRVVAAVTGRPFLHLWNDMFRRNGSRAIDEPEPGSFLDLKFREHGSARRRLARVFAVTAARLSTPGWQARKSS